VPRRPFPSSSKTQFGLRADAKVYELLPNGTQTSVPSGINLSGGGGDEKSEYVNFYVDIPMEPSERDAVIREYLAALGRSANDENSRHQADLLQKMDPEVFAHYFRQHRVGRFRVNCRVLDEGRVFAVGRVDLEVVFKGNLSDLPTLRK
jgi:hypothetical protein